MPALGSLINFTLEDSLRGEYVRCMFMAYRMACGPFPSGDAASDAFDSAYDELEYRIQRLSSIIKKRYES